MEVHTVVTLRSKPFALVFLTYEVPWVELGLVVSFRVLLSQLKFLILIDLFYRRKELRVGLLTLDISVWRREEVWRWHLTTGFSCSIIGINLHREEFSRMMMAVVESVLDFWLIWVVSLVSAQLSVALNVFSLSKYYVLRWNNYWLLIIVLSFRVWWIFGMVSIIVSLQWWLWIELGLASEVFGRWEINCCVPTVLSNVV